MTERDLGTKLSCQNCEAKFYDLKKKTPVCPKCDTEYVAVKPRTRRAAAKAVVEASVAETPANDDAPETDDEVLKELEVEVEDDDDDEGSDKSLMENTSDMDGDDDEDVAGVIGNFDPTAANNDN